MLHVLDPGPCSPLLLQEALSDCSELKAPVPDPTLWSYPWGGRVGGVQEGGRVGFLEEEASKSNTEKVRGQVQKPSKASRAQELLGGGGECYLSMPPTPTRQWL